ncbi:hypothetical protein MKY04_09375 [Lysinibacillus telephonicus]|uniref:hypothetical protein n=1 Tax=Lysinibacillus telephonicus TaxID=1714840 RepID=UPI0031FC891F
MPEQLPKWQAIGTEPTIELQTNGWQPGMKPSAQHMNWLFNRAYKCLEDLQNNKADLTALSTLSQTVSIIENQLSNEPPVQSTLVRGEQTLTTEHDSTARVTAFEGDTIVNLAPLFDSGLWVKNPAATITIDSPNKITMVTTGPYETYLVKVSVKPNTPYFLGVIAVGDGVLVDWGEYDLSGNVIGTVKPNNSSFTTSSNAASIQINLSNTKAGTFTYENVTLVEGTEPKTFVANIQGITNPTIDNPTTGDSLTFLGTFHKGDVVSEDKGQYFKIKAVEEMILDGSLPWVHSNVGTDYKIASVNLGINGVAGSEKVVKYNGKILPIVGSDWTKGDEVQLWTTSNVSTLYISALNTDTGFGPNYVPTADEWKAYFLGWRMYDANATVPPQNGGNLPQYNGATGQIKGWAKMDYTTPYGWRGSTGTLTLPTVRNDLQGWQPYKLVFDLASPVKEPVQAINTVLKLSKGDNALQVSEGRIVREVVKAYYDGNTKTSYINARNTSLASASWTSIKTDNILQVYADGEPVEWFIGHQTVNGEPYAYAAIEFKVDETIQFSIDYEPLYTFGVTAPTNPITIEYQSNLASVVNQNVEDIVELKEDVAVIQRDMVIKGEGLNWLNGTLLNGFTGYVRFAKDSNNYVHIAMSVKTPTVPSINTLICRLPDGFLPYDTTVIPLAREDGSIQPGVLAFKYLKGVVCQSNSGFVADKSLYGYVMYKAN